MGNNWGKEEEVGVLGDLKPTRGAYEAVGQPQPPAHHRAPAGPPQPPDATHRKRPPAPNDYPQRPTHGIAVPTPGDVATKAARAETPATPGVRTEAADLSMDVDIGAVPGNDSDEVPTVFRWEHGGRQVYVTGTFNNWETQIPMHRSGNDFTYIHNLKKGKHAFRFVVDNEWRFAPDQQTVADIDGRINNFIDVSDFRAYTGDEQFLLRRPKSISSDMYTRHIPDLDEYTKDPPPLPPHLRHIILNKAPPANDPNALPTPQHVALNHLYCTAIKDGMMVLGVTIRYRQTSCTTVYYSCS